MKISAQMGLMLASAFFLGMLLVDTISFAQQGKSETDAKGMFDRLKAKLEEMEEQIKEGEVDVSMLLGTLGKVGRYELFQAKFPGSKSASESGLAETSLFKIDTNTGDVWILRTDPEQELAGQGWSRIQNVAEIPSATTEP